MATKTAICAYCGSETQKHSGHYNRSTRLGRPMYCDQNCSGAARRLDPETKARNLRENNRKYKAAKPEKYKAIAAAGYQRRRDPEKERQFRKANMPRHVEYCRKPEYRAKKQEYDIERSKREYGEYGECYRLLIELGREIRKQCPDRYERLKARGYFTRERVRERKSQWERMLEASRSQ